tara:strand:- start:542 stop:1828 length:1287 start_codon:yes stop_codon:yes gene_type:complete
MLTVSPELTLIILSPLPLLSVLIYRVSHNINFKSSIVQNQLSKLTNTAQEAFLGIRLIKSFVREKNIIKEFNHVSEEYMNHSIQLSKINAIFFPLISLLVGVSILLTIYVGGISVIDGSISVGEITEFIIYVNMLTWPATSIGWVTEVIQRAAASQSRINEFLNNKDYTSFHLSSQEDHIFKHQLQYINFTDLSYTYSGSNSLAINCVNLDLKVNNITAFVGHVGSGKTTILQLMAGILKPSSGHMFLDDIPSDHFDWFKFRNSVSYIHQDVFLFSDSIRNNILFGVKDVSKEDLFNIAKQVHMLDEIQGFENGFDTIIGEGGITLSGGQKQRIALARALIRKPSILFLDDALSNVDSSTEIKIVNYITNNLTNTAIFLTSNRLSVLSLCNQIFVLKSGKVIQEGSHKDLIQKEGEYQKLFFRQMVSR